MPWRVEPHRRKQPCQRTRLLRSSDTNGDSRSLRQRHGVAPRRSHAMPDAKPRVNHHTMARMRMTVAAHSNSGPHAGGDRLLLLAHGMGIEGGHVHDGVAHPL